MDLYSWNCDNETWYFKGTENSSVPLLIQPSSTVVGICLQNCSLNIIITLKAYFLPVVAELRWCVSKALDVIVECLHWKRKVQMWGGDCNDWWQAPAGSWAPLGALLFDSVWVLQECNLDFRLKCIVGLNACRWAQFFCSFVVSYILICISYKKLGSDWSTVEHCFLDIFHFIILKNNFVGHTWYQKKKHTSNE